MLKQVSYTIAEVAPYINWSYFYHAWLISGRSEERGGRSTEEKVRSEIRGEAECLLREWEGKYHTHVCYGLFDANSDGDDIVVESRGSRVERGGARDERRVVRIPMLRQQCPIKEGEPCFCLADFVRPLTSGQKDTVGVFAATVDSAMESDYRDDTFMGLLAQTLADRLAEATVEMMHEHVRKHEWGYAPDESLTIEQLHREAFQGIRPAVGYPSLPDTSLNFLLDELLDMQQIGIRLTESGMMIPHASVSGLMIAHPQAKYFHLGRIGEDQLYDYAARRGMPADVVRKFIIKE